MGPEQRRQWVRKVLGHSELKSGAKVVLLALGTYANYDDGSEAHPGEDKLAADTGLTTRAVQLAMRQGRELGLIIRTKAANPKAGKAAEWKLTMPPDDDPNTRTTVRVENVSTRTTVRVDNPNTRTDVRVETGQYPNQQVVSTRTPVPTTFPAPSLIGETSGGGGKSVDANGPRPQCHLHDENDDEPCRYCKRRRKWDEANPGWRERDELERRRRLREIADACPRCHGTGTYTVGDNLSAKCDPHLTPEAIAHV